MLLKKFVLRIFTPNHPKQTNLSDKDSRREKTRRIKNSNNVHKNSITEMPSNSKERKSFGFWNRVHSVVQVNCLSWQQGTPWCSFFRRYYDLLYGWRISNGHITLFVLTKHSLIETHKLGITLGPPIWPLLRPAIVEMCQLKIRLIEKQQYFLFLNL